MFPLLALLGGGKTKIIIIIIAVLAVVVGGFWIYQKVLVSNLRAELAEKEVQLTVLKGDNNKLLLSNKSLQQEIVRRAKETKSAYAEITRLSDANEASRARLSDIQRKLRDVKKREQANRVRNSRKADLLVRLMDKNVECYLKNFDKVDGECIRGKWVTFGSRSVPRVTPQDIDREAAKEKIDE